MSYFILQGFGLAANACLLVYLVCQLRRARQMNAATEQVHAAAKTVLVKVRILEDTQELKQC